MTAEESAAIRHFRERVDNAIIAWSRGLRDVIQECADELLATLAEEQVRPDSWRDEVAS